MDFEWYPDDYTEQGLHVLVGLAENFIEEVKEELRRRGK